MPIYLLLSLPYMYENYQIGSFIYTVGYRAAMRAARDVGWSEESGAMALGVYQRERLDQSLADVFMGFKGRYLLIEFKTRFGGLVREREKRVKELLLKRLEVADTAIKACADSSHFLGIGVEGAPDQESLCFASYRTGMDSPDEAAFKALGWALPVFLDQLLDRTIGVDRDPFRFYLNQFKVCVDQANREAQEAAAKASGSSGAGGIEKKPRRIVDPVPSGIVASVGKSGEILLLPFNGIEMLHEMYQSMGGRAPEREKSIKPPSLGL